MDGILEIQNKFRIKLFWSRDQGKTQRIPNYTIFVTLAYILPSYKDMTWLNSQVCAHLICRLTVYTNVLIRWLISFLFAFVPLKCLDNRLILYYKGRKLDSVSSGELCWFYFFVELQNKWLYYCFVNFDLPSILSFIALSLISKVTESEDSYY